MSKTTREKRCSFHVQTEITLKFLLPECSKQFGQLEAIRGSQSIFCLLNFSKITSWQKGLSSNLRVCRRSRRKTMPIDGFHWRQQPEGLTENLCWPSRSYIRYASEQRLPLFWTASVVECITLGYNWLFPRWEARQLSSELHDDQNMDAMFNTIHSIRYSAWLQNIYNIVFTVEELWHF